MKNKKSFYAFPLFLAFAMFACEEVPPTVQLDRYECDAPAATAQPRRVLVEEFTGVKCVNCPDGAAQIESLIDQNPGRLIAVSIHTGFFSTTYPNSTQDMTFPDGPAINNLVGNVEGYPAAVINRKLFAGEATRPLGQTKWPGYIQSELQQAPLVNVEIVNIAYDAVLRRVTFDVVLDCNDNVKSEIAVTALITEDSIVSPQETRNGIVDEYVHKHVLRAMQPNANGLTVPQLPFTQSFSFDLAPLWESEHCHIVAFAHYKDVTGGNVAILQAATEHVE